MEIVSPLEVWFVTGSQHLYGEDTLKQVAHDSQCIADALHESTAIPVKIVAKPIVTTPDAIRTLCQEANATSGCIGLITWMHTFSPAKMWIAGLGLLKKPFMHLHTQFNRDIPWTDIDMDYMNLHQSAHGGREFGFICTRMRLNRKVVVGHWQEPEVQDQVGAWCRAAKGWAECQGLKIARFGDNMREVAVTEGDKVETQMRFGWSISGYGVGDLVAAIDSVQDSDIDDLMSVYESQYTLAPALKSDGDKRSALRECAGIELGLRSFLDAGGFKAFTTTFEDLHGLPQLPGLAVQRLMADGYGFGAEGDWKTAALVRVMKVMADGMSGGTSFMEDYTYHLDPAGPKVLGAHMLEVCPSIASGKPSLEIHALGIGGKDDPARLVFDAAPGPGLNASVIDMGNRFRLVVNTVEVVEPEAELPKLPVACALWEAQPDLKTAAAAWILSGAAHHSSFSQALTVEHMEDLAQMADMEMLLIDDETRLREFKKELIWNAAAYDRR